MSEERSAAVIMDLEGRIISCSDAIGEVAGIPAPDLVGRDLDTVFGAVDGADLAGAITELALQPAGRDVRSHRIRPPPEPAGALRATLLRVSADSLAAVVTRAPSVGEHDRVISLLESSWSRATEGMAMTTDADQPGGPRVIAANRAFGRLLAVAPDRARGRSLAELLDPAGAVELVARLRARLADGPDPVADHAIRMQSGQSHVLLEWELSSLRWPEGPDGNLMCLVRDVTEASARNRTLRSPDVDVVTGLPNQIQFLRRVARSVERAAQGREYAFAVVGIDVGGFQSARTRWGPVISHFVMEALVWRVRECLRPGDLIARIGDHRLAALLEHFGPWGDLEQVLERLRRATEDPYTVGGDRVRLTITGAAVPVSGRGRPPRSAQAVVDELDRVLVARRASGGPQRAGAAGVRGSRAHRALHLDLEDALNQNQLVLRYLPVVSLEDDGVVGLEALVRWQHPRRGLLRPGEFIGDAERSGSIVSLGQWVFASACRQLADWVERGGRVPPVHVNLSASEFWHAELADHVEREIRRAGVDPSLLRLEVHEATLAMNVQGARNALSRLHDAGVELWLESFGGGGFPLDRLPSLPVRCVKLDPKTIWQRVEGDAVRPAPLLRPLIGLAHELGWSIVGGGVETRDQRDVLASEHCDLGQGYLFSEPLGVEEAGALRARMG